MQPQQQTPNYDFIMNPGTPPKKRPLGNSSLAIRILVVLGGLFVLAILAAVVIRLLGGGTAGFNKTAMLSVAQDQTEIVRVAIIGDGNSVSQTNKNFSATAELGVKSDQTALLNFLAANGYGIKAKTLLLKQNAQTDQTLTNAQSSSTFDEAYRSVMQQYLQSYERDLQAAYKGASPAAQTVLKANYTSAQLLSQQLTANN